MTEGDEAASGLLDPPAALGNGRRERSRAWPRRRTKLAGGISQLTISELDRGAIERWHELASRAHDPNPFFEPDFLIPAQRHLEGAPDRLLVLEGAQGWDACVPLARRRWRRVVRVEEAGEATYGFLATPLLGGDDPGAIADRLVAALATARVYPLLAQRLQTASPFHAALERAAAAGSLRILERRRFERALWTSAEDEPLAHLNRHHVRELQRMGRRLTEELGGSLQSIDRAGDAQATERFLELELAGWKGKAGTAFASNPRHAEFFRELCQRFHAAGRLELLELGGERAAAMKCNLIAGSGSFGFKIAFDEDYGRWSPGIQLEVANARRLNAGELEWMDSCADPGNAMINRLWPGRRELCTIVVGDHDARSSAAASSLAVALRLRAARVLVEQLRR